MSRLKTGLIVGMAALLFGGVAVFYFRNSTKTDQAEESKPAASVIQEGVGQVPGICIKPKTFVMTQQKKIEDYQKMVEVAITQAKEQGASEEEIKTQTEQLAKSIASIALTDQALRGGHEDQPEYFQLSTEQEPGKALKVKHVMLVKPGFVVVGPPLIGRMDDTKFIAAHFLQSGTYSDITVPLSRYMDRYEAYVSLYEDDGDQIFDRSKDRMLTYRRKGVTDDRTLDEPALIKVRFKSDRSLDQYQSAYLDGKTKWEGLIAFEQVPGNLINLYVARSYVPAWVAVHESNNGCTGKVLGTHSLVDEPEAIALAKQSGAYTPQLAESYKDMHRQKESFDILLSRDVRSETLFAVMYADNGDGRFDLATDTPLKGINGETVGIEFPVIKGRE